MSDHPHPDATVAEPAASAGPGTPPIRFPAELPISARAEELIEAIRTHQVLVVAGETGSGKSTQLPKLCLAAGRGDGGLIGHTQPRRIAARAVAERVAEELGGRIGGTVAWQVRFTDTTSADTRVKLMTDGILLAEIQRDPDLRRYDTLIIDEAHERGLNVDFILGYLRQLLPRRPDLRVIVTSATIDTARFAEHFAVDGQPAPVVEVSGRTYPVEVRYRPLVDDQGRERDVLDGIVDAVDELVAEGPGDILVFASGQRDIRDAADALQGRHRDTEVLPLYARLSAQEQHRVFAPHRGRRIVIATNIAETSLTVPGIRYVVDPGLARISRFNRRTKVQRLPIEEISRASADQRAGRCGRVAPGVAIRLYDEEDLAARPEFTEPEILRTNLASVILQMTAIGLGDVEAVPFVEPPDRRLVADGVALLEELGAVTDDPRAPGGRRLTDVGRKLARLPIDPRVARMVLAGADEGCLKEVLVIAAALSIQDPRERPQDKAHTADRYHAAHADPSSDFLTLLNLWTHLRGLQRQLSGNQFRKRCKQEFLHHLRVREWQDVHSQLRRIAHDLDLPRSSASAGGELDQTGRDAVHRALLAGLLSNIGVRDGTSRAYLGTRGSRFTLGRHSALAEHPPGWVMAAELVETHRLFAGLAAAIRPGWVEPLAGDLVQRTHGEAEWDGRRGSAVTTERVTFRGVPIVQGRRINLARVDPAAARSMFLDRALVAGDWGGDLPVLVDNRARAAEVAKLEARLRRPGLMAPEDVLRDAYEQLVPAEVVSASTFQRWHRRASADHPRLLEVDVEQLLAAGAGELHALRDFPDTWQAGEDADLALEYRHTPDDPEADGVTVDIPLEALPRLDAGHFDWQVPGLREELVIALIRGLPKPLRRALVPAPETARAVLAEISPADGPLLPTLAAALTRHGGVPVTPDAWAGVRLPDHLRMRYRIIGRDGVLAAGTDLGALKAGVSRHLRQAVRRSADVPSHTGLTAWTIGDLPREVRASRDGVEVIAHPALVDEGATVGVKAYSTPQAQAAAMAAGTRRLLRLSLANPVKVVALRLDKAEKLALTLAPHDDVAAVVEDCTACVLDAIVEDAGGPAWTEEGFAALREQARERAPDLVVVTARATARIVSQAQQVRERLRAPLPPALEPARRDLARQLGRMVYPGFVAATGGAHLGHLPRYLQAMLVRIESMGRNPERDADHLALVTDLEEDLRLLVDRGLATPAAAAPVRWSIEELRVSLFAQQLGTAERISERRIRDRIAALRRPG